MFTSARVCLSLTQVSDLDFVIATENSEENKAFIKQWSREEHINTIERNDRQHWLITSMIDGKKLGYLISYDLHHKDCGTYIKRIALMDKGQGIGRQAIGLFLQHTFSCTSPYVWLCVYPDNIRGQRCYQALGFSLFESSLTERERHVQVAENASSDHLMLMYIPKSAYADKIA